jgi:hypothetical protein
MHRLLDLVWPLIPVTLYLTIRQKLNSDKFVDSYTTLNKQSLDWPCRSVVDQEARQNLPYEYLYWNEPQSMAFSIGVTSEYALLLRPVLLRPSLGRLIALPLLEPWKCFNEMVPHSDIRASVCKHKDIVVVRICPGYEISWQSKEPYFLHLNPS